MKQSSSTSHHGPWPGGSVGLVSSKAGSAPAPTEAQMAAALREGVSDSSSLSQSRHA
jgi:hypothetical protein